MSAFCGYKKSPTPPEYSRCLRQGCLPRSWPWVLHGMAHKSLLPWAWAAAEERRGVFSKGYRSCEISPGQTVLEARSRHSAPNYSVIDKM